jgi:hypothetical protein
MSGQRSSVYRLTANDRFKRSAGSWLWGSVMVATVFHFGLFKFFPELTASDVSYGVNEFEAIELPPEVEIPPPPEQITRPAVPVVAATELEEDITIAPTTFEENPVENLPPPPSDASRLSDQPVFTPYTVRPEIKAPQGRRHRRSGDGLGVHRHERRRQERAGAEGLGQFVPRRVGPQGSAGIRVHAGPEPRPAGARLGGDSDYVLDQAIADLRSHVEPGTAAAVPGFFNIDSVSPLG